MAAGSESTEKSASFRGKMKPSRQGGEAVGWNIIPLFLTFRLIAHLQGEGASLMRKRLVSQGL